MHPPKRLVEIELAAVSPDPDLAHTHIGGPDVPLRPAIVQTLALALHELATNALKHGALGMDPGRLDVTWTVNGTAGAPRLLLRWTESGLRLPDGPVASDHRGYGRELIEDALPYSLGAQTSFNLTAEGVACTIALPLKAPGERHHA